MLKDKFFHNFWQLWITINNNIIKEEIIVVLYEVIFSCLTENPIFESWVFFVVFNTNAVLYWPHTFLCWEYGYDLVAGLVPLLLRDGGQGFRAGVCWHTVLDAGAKGAAHSDWGCRGFVLQLSVVRHDRETHSEGLLGFRGQPAEGGRETNILADKWIVANGENDR